MHCSPVLLRMANPGSTVGDRYIPREWIRRDSDVAVKILVISITGSAGTVPGHEELAVADRDHLESRDARVRLDMDLNWLNAPRA
jgi:hypothetical protein